MARPKKTKPNGNGANPGFEEKLWAAARLEKPILKNLGSLGFSPKEKP